MHPQVIVGLALALACAGGTNLGGLWKRKGALECPSVDVRRPLQTAAALFRSKWFVLGWLVAALGWLLHVGALALAPLSLAQAVISGGLVLLGILAERYFGFSLNRRQWIGLALVALGMAVLAGTAHSEGSHSSYAVAALAAFEGAVIVLGAAFVLGSRLGRLRDNAGVLLGAAAGLLFGVSDVSIKAVTGGHGALVALLPWVMTALLAGICAFYASARSFQVGDGIAVIAATAAAANVIGIVGGVLVFGDPLGSNALTVGGRVAAFVLVVVAVSLIPAPVRAEEAVEAGEEEDAPARRAVTAGAGAQTVAEA